MNSYQILLFVHSWLRWAVLIVAVIAIFNAFGGWLSKSPFGKKDNALQASFVGLMHTQLLIGLILYFFLSPLGSAAFEGGMGAVMKNGALRYWAVEHITVMILAVIVAQVGRSISKKAQTAPKKHRVSAIAFSVALVLMLSRIPWNEAGRLFRGL
jgi:hypothetical protein